MSVLSPIFIMRIGLVDLSPNLITGTFKCADDKHSPGDHDEMAGWSSEL